MAVIETETIVSESQISALVDSLLTNYPPEKTKSVDFLAAQFDAGLAWVHFEVGNGGLGASPKYQKIVNEAIAAANGPSSYARNPIGYGMCAPTIAQWGTEEQ
ncbi:MAG: acyl-CoA dehydrogenase, partial [Actinobacteria bacterium]|nr:acyl-CoA dehydrogenase [Actinomycetota bacterium]